MTVEFTVDGMNPRQQFLADIIWACDTLDEVQRFIRNLPTQAMRREAQVVAELIKMAAIEQCYDGIAEPMDVKALLAKISIRK